MGRKIDPKYKKIDLINKIVEMSCNGICQPEIIIWLKEEGKCQISYSYELLREAKPIILDVLKDVSKDRLETTIRELEQMMYEAKGLGERKLVLEIKKEINKITGLHGQKIDITSGGEKITEIRLVQINRNINDESVGD